MARAALQPLVAKAVDQTPFVALGSGRTNAGHIKIRGESRGEVVRLYESGWSAPRIASKFGVKPDCIYAVLDQAGVKRNRTGQRNKKVDDHLVVAAYLTGESQVEIAARLGVAQSAVSASLKRSGVATRHAERVLTEEDEQAIEARYRNGEVATEICLDYGVFHSRVLALLRRRGVPIRKVTRVVWTDGRGRKHSFRSKWELWVAQHLDTTGVTWDYEKCSYDVTVNEKQATYTPDFWVYDSRGDLAALIDVKGYLTTTQGTKIAAFQRQYPDLPYEMWRAETLRALGLLGPNTVRTGVA